MKQLYKVLLAVASVIPALVSCNKVEEKNSEPVKVVRTVQFSAGEVTKTVFGTQSENKIPTLWTENKTVGISLNLASTKQSTTPEVLDGGTKAKFSADIDDSGSSPYTFYAVSPYSSVVSVSDSYKSIQVEIPASQTPLATSVDEDAQILVAKYSAGTTFPTTSVLMDFKHLTAYGKISFSNLALADGEKIVSVSLTADENWAGRYYYYVEDYDPYSAGDFVEKTAGKTITLSTSSSSDIWFACAPVNLGDKKIKVVIATDQGNTYTKRINIPSGEKYLFESGKVNAFTINMNGIEPDGPVQYDLVTNAAELTVGRQVIIAASGNTAVAMSTTQNGNNRGQASVTKTTGGAAITSPGDAVQILTIEAGTEENTIAFNTGEAGYIYAAGSGKNNYLRTQTTNDANGSWSVSITAAGVATIAAQGSNTNNQLRYNSNNSIFSCYSSGQGDVAIYMLAADWVLDNITATAPTKTIYEAGEFFDPTGMVVTAHYVDADDNTHTKDVVIANENLTFSPALDAALTTDVTEVSISYGGKSTTQTITVNAAKVWDLKSIAVTTEPDKTTYTEGEFFDPTGLVVTATFEEHDNTSNTKEVVVNNANLVFTPDTSTALTTSDEVVTISYTVGEINKTINQAITVNKAIVYYEKVTSAPSNWAGDYLIVYEASSTSGEVLTGVSSNIGQHTTVVISDSKIVADDYDDYNVQIEQSSGSYTMKLGNKYLAYTNTSTSGNNNLYGVDNATTNGALWTLSVDDARNVYNTSRYLRYNTGSPRFCCYTSGQQKISFYKLNDGKSSAGVSLSYSGGTITYGDNPVQLTLSNPNGVAVTCSSDDTGVADVTDAALITIKGAGSATITASWDEQTISSTTYRAGSVTYELTVAKKTPIIAEFSDPTTSVAKGSTVTNTTTISDGLTITYTSSNTNVATVTSAGVVTGVDDGTATISATFTGNANFNAATTQSYTITVGTGGGGGGQETHYYVKVTDLSTLSAGDKILLINTNHDALPAFTSTGTLSPTDLHTSKYDSTNDRFPTDDSTVDNCAITLVAPTTAINNKVVFKLKMSNNYYIVKTGTSGTGFNPNTTSTAVSGDWTLSADNNGRVNIKNNLENSSRCIIWRSGDQNKFGAYASGNINNTEYYNVNIYKLN